MADQALNLDPDFRSSHIFSTADITGTFGGLTQGRVEDGDTPVIDFDGITKVTQEGVTLYPINSEFSYVVTDFIGAVEKDFVLNPEYEEGWAGDLKGEGGEQLGLVLSDVETGTFKTPALLGTWLAGIGGSTVKASTEHYVVMQNILSDQRYPGDPLASYPLDDELIVIGGTYDGQAVADVIPLIGDINGDGVADIKDVLAPNESTITENIAVSSDYSVTLKDDGKLLYRWGNTIKKPSDIRIEAQLPLPDEWKAQDADKGGLIPLYRVTQAELVVEHTITNNPNDQIRPEDFENESAIGQLPDYQVLSDGRWVSTADYYAGDGTFFPAGTVLRDPALAVAAANSDLAQIGALSSDLVGGYTNAWYTTMNREPFEAELDESGNYIVGPRWRLQPDKYGQDLPSVVIPEDPSLPPPPTKGEVKYEVGEDTQTVINLLDWALPVSPLSISAGWQNNSGSVSANGLNMSPDFDIAFYLKGDIKPATLYSTDLLLDYEEIVIEGEGGFVVGTSGDDYLAGQGANTFIGDANGDTRGQDMFVLSYGVIGNLARIQNSTVLDFEYGRDTIGLIDLGVTDTNFGELIGQSVSGGSLQITVGGFDLVTLDGVAAPLAFEDFLLVNRNMLPVAGTELDDYLIGSTFDDILHAGLGDDTVLGFEGDDGLYGEAGEDTLDGGLGDDILVGGLDADTLIGGAGRDTASYKDASAAISVSLALGQGLDGEALGDTLTSIEKVMGSEYDDTLAGDSRNNTLVGRDGDDVLSGGGGNDWLTGGLGADAIDGGIGIDRAAYGGSGEAVSIDLDLGTAAGGDAAGDVLTNVENLTGSRFDDILTGNAARNELSGGDGDDTLSGGVGNDVLVGGNGADTLDGGADSDTATYETSTAGVIVSLSLGSGSGGMAEGDVLVSIENVTGSRYSDWLVGDANTNRLTGGAGDDVLDGSDGIDVLNGGAGADVIIGGNGNDILDYGSSDRGVIVDLLNGTGSGGDAEGDSIYSVERVFGSSHSDMLVGNDGDNVLKGQLGNDILDGGLGDDRMLGGEGNDHFLFNAGSDLIDGGLGSDIAYFDGLQTDYAITNNGAGSWQVLHIATGDTDTLLSIETLHFDNGDLFA